jgi:hypothetical protein
MARSSAVSTSTAVALVLTLSSLGSGDSLGEAALPPTNGTAAAPWTQLLGLSGGWFAIENLATSLGRVATAGGHAQRGRTLEQGAAFDGMLQAQALSALDSNRGVLAALLEDGPLRGGATLTHLVLWSALTGRVIDVCVAPPVPNDGVGAGQYLAIDEAENRALVIGRDARHGEGSAFIWTWNLGNNCSAQTPQKLGERLPVVPGANLGLSYSALDQKNGMWWVQLPMAPNMTGTSAAHSATNLAKSRLSPPPPAFETVIAGLDSHSGLVVHRLDLYGKDKPNPAALAYDSGQGRVVGLGVSYDENTHAMVGSELFALDAVGGSALTIRKDVLPSSITAVLSGMATVDATGRILYFGCLLLSNETLGGKHRPKAGDFAAAPGSRGFATLRSSSGVVGHPHPISRGDSHATTSDSDSEEVPMAGLCAVDVDSGDFIFGEGVCAEQPRCPWNLQYWNVPGGA